MNIYTNFVPYFSILNEIWTSKKVVEPLKEPFPPA